MDELYSWQYIGTLAGAAMITYLIVAYTKRAVDAWWPPALGTDLYAVLVAWLVLLAAMGAQGELSGLLSVVLCLFNGFLVAAAAGKLNDKAISEAERQESRPADHDGM